MKKRYTLMMAVMLLAWSGVMAQTRKVSGNFSGDGIETLCFVPIGFTTPAIDAETPEDVYEIISNKDMAPLLIQGIKVFPMPCGDIDGDGRDELAIVCLGLGAWGGLHILDYEKGKWNTLIKDGSTYLFDDGADDFETRHLVKVGDKPGTLVITTWGEIEDDPWQGVDVTYKIKRKPYKVPVKEYYDHRGVHHKVK